MAFRNRTRRRRLTRPGQVLLLTAALVLLAAWNTGENLYYLIFAGVASFALASWLLSRWNLGRLRLVRIAPDAVHRRTWFAVSARIENPRRMLPAISVRIESTARPGRSAGYALVIPARKAAHLTMTEWFEKRGVSRLPDLEFVSSFPFGLVEARVRVSDASEVVVYPRVKAARTAIVDRAPGTRDAPRSSQRDGDEYFSLREYEPGDDLRYVAWRASARLGNLMVKEFEQETSRSVLLVLDSRRDDLEGFEERFEEAIELVASLAVTLLNRHYSVSLLTASGGLNADEGKAQALKVLDFLARLDAAPPTADDPFSRAMGFEEARRVVYLFCSPDPARWGARLAGGARILDPREVIHA
ncbi:MAG: DUF58 domain-containing protein [Candidatus Hydrogenedentes bacterium]|nr:DUF58 domain-containing protein [Candidatus Hydrogenedentota bacterium]